MSNRVKEIVCFRPDRGSRVIELLIGGEQGMVNRDIILGGGEYI